VLFEQNMRCLKSHDRPSQKELFPSVVQFEPSECVMLESLLDDICGLGFDLSNLGGGSYSVNGIPSDIEGVDVEKLLHDMLSSVQSEMSDVRKDAQEALALTLAEKSAIVYGQVLTTIEMEHLLRDLFATKMPARTPDGKLIYTIVEDSYFENFF